MGTAHAEIRKERKRNHWRWSAYLTGAFFLALLSLPTAEDQEEGRAYAAGSFYGALAVPLGIALILRLLYVKLVHRDGRPVISPWLFAIAVPIALMARAGQLSENG
ncbi:MAG TPA: hypothetical protein VE440_00635 [Gaiellaceae bacterium]|nr:hypothetical protein [Gaiellaceae bacterium]